MVASLNYAGIKIRVSKKQKIGYISINVCRY